MWMAAVDFKKAFDSVTHRSIWRALAAQGMPLGYVQLIDKLYKKQIGTVRTEKLSKGFSIEKGVKQGDPLSSLLFNCVSEYVLRPLKQRWNSRGHGIKVKPGEENLTNLRFADDILLISSSLESMTQMLTDLSIAAADAGLSLHPEKTKVLRNRWIGSRKVPNHVTANGMEIEVLGVDGNTKYLGRKLTFTDPHQTEVESRIASAWKKFHVQKQELMNRDFSLNDRLRLFHGTVTPTVLYGCEAWTMTADLEQRLRVAQRQMLRMMLQMPRRRIQTTSDTDRSEGEEQQGQIDGIDISTDESLEPWQEWIRRSTREVEHRMGRLKIEDWVTLQRRRKWRWANKVAISTQEAWGPLVLKWDPSPHLGVFQNRRIGRPKLRWADDIKRYLYWTLHTTTPAESINPRFDNTWLEYARSTSHWKQLEDGYANKSV